MDKVKFENNRDLELVGNYWKADSDAGIVMAHGFTGDKTEWGYFDKVAEELNDAGYNVLAFDFTGSGESDDEPLRIDNQVEDLKVAIDYLESRGNEMIGIYGHSQGGLIALRNYNENIEVMVLTSPVTDNMPNYRQIILNEEGEEELEKRDYWTIHEEKGIRDKIVVDEEIIEEKENIDQDKLLSSVDCPTLIIHGDKDEIVSLESSQRAVQKLENSELRVIEDLDHGYDDHLDEVAKYAVNWFKEYFPKNF